MRRGRPIRGRELPRAGALERAQCPARGTSGRGTDPGRGSPVEFRAPRGPPPRIIPELQQSGANIFTQLVHGQRPARFQAGGPRGRW